MALNNIFISFFLIAFVACCVQAASGNVGIFEEAVNSTFSSAKTGFELSIGLTGVMTLWLGLMKVGEKGGLIAILAKMVAPLFKKLFPEIPANHPVTGSIVMNLSANMLGLDNAATPLGLKAMDELQKLNPKPETASNAQIMFLVLNTSGLTLIPISVMVYRAQMGAAAPADVFLPILLSTFFSTMVGLLAVCIKQKINLFNKTIIAYLGGITLLISAIIWFFTSLSTELVQTYSALGGNFILLSIITLFIALGLKNKLDVYSTFIEGAKEGFYVAIKIIPFLVAMLVAIGLFRTSGAMDFLISGIAGFFNLIGLPNEFVDALPTAFMKPLSGSGARGMMVEAMNTYGVDSFVGRLAATMQGATDTTFYIIAVYFGSVGIKNTRYAVGMGLLADLAGIIAAIFMAYLFFG